MTFYYQYLLTPSVLNLLNQSVVRFNRVNSGKSKSLDFFVEILVNQRIVKYDLTIIATSNYCSTNRIITAKSIICLITQYIGLKIQFSREHPLSSKIFAQEIIAGAPRLKEYFASHYQVWFASKIAVFKQWADEKKIDPVDPAHLMFLIWSSTQHYADFNSQVSAALGKKSIQEDDYLAATNTLTHIITQGIGCKPR